MRIIAFIEDYIEDDLRKEGFEVTSFYGNGKDGDLKVLNVICKKNQIRKLNSLAAKIDPGVFVVSHTLQCLRGGFIYGVRPR